MPKLTIEEAFKASLRRVQEASVPKIDFEVMPEWFHAGQQKLWESQHEIVVALAGAQSGKSVAGPHWMLREIQRRGEGDYLICGPTFTLLEKKAIPETENLFCRNGWFTFNRSLLAFKITPKGSQALFGKPGVTVTVNLGYAARPDSLEAATYKAIWADEAGQDEFRQGSWEALQRRRSVFKGRVLITTTPYGWNWLKTTIYDPWLAGERPHIEIINFLTKDNPSQDPAYIEQVRLEMPKWRFEMMYEGKFTRPAGVVYDSFDRKQHTCTPFKIPYTWQILQGVDFGTRNGAAVWLAQDPKSGVWFVFRTYHGSGEASDHVEKWSVDDSEFFEWPKDIVHTYRKPKKRSSVTSVGGAASENDWRTNFAMSGWPIARPPIQSMDVQVDRVRQLINSGKIVIFSNLSKLIEEIETLSYKMGEDGNPLPEIDRESDTTRHRHAALRYAATMIDLDSVPTESVRGSGVSRVFMGMFKKPKVDDDD